MYRIFKLPQIGFIGAGNLVEVLTKGWISAGTLQIHNIWASGPTEKSIHKVKQLGCQTTTCNLKLVHNNKVVVLAAKPQVLPKILQEIAPAVTPDHLLLSFAAGLYSTSIEYPINKLPPIQNWSPIQV